MAFLCVAIRRDSISFLMFPSRSHVLVFSSEISPVCRLKYPYRCFSSNFYFLIFVVVPFVLMLSVVVVISLSLFLSALSACIDAFTQSSSLDIYRLFISSLECIVIIFYPLIAV